MATSGITRLDLTVNKIIYEAYDLLQVATDGEPIDGDLSNRALASLQILLKLWETQGIHLWTETEGHLFLEVGRAEYDFDQQGRLTGDVHLTNTFEQRALDGAVTAPAFTVDVDSASSDRQLAGGDLIGILGEDNDLEWFTIMDVSGNTVRLSNPTSVNAADQAIVYTYPRYAATELSANELLGATVLNVASTAELTPGDTVLVRLNDGTTDELEIDSVDEGAGTITTTVGLTSAADSGNGVVDLSNIRTPFKAVKRIMLNGVRRRESTDYEIPIVNQSRQDYFDLPNKNQNGTVIQTYYSRQLAQGIMYCWNPPSNATSVINFTYEREIEVPTEVTQTLDLPADWYDAVIYNLAKRLIPKVGCSQERKADIVAGATEYLDNALAMDQAVYPVRLKPQRYG